MNTYFNPIIFFEAFYRGNFVALKKVHKRSIDLTRSIKKELKLMREVNIMFTNHSNFDNKNFVSISLVAS
jgi:hypothetical protein